MYDLHKPFNNPFDDAAIGLNNLLAFTSDNIVRMTNNNTGGFLTTRITATSTALGAVNTAFQVDLSKLGERKTSKKAKADYRITLKTGAGEIHVALQGKYGRNSAMLDTFFPQGLSKFNAMTDDQVANGWTALISELTNHQAEVGAAIVAQATELKDGWLAVYEPSEDATGAKDSAMEVKHAARQALQLELCRNWLTIALQFPRQPEKLDVYMQQSLLEPNTIPPEPEPPVPPVPPTPTP